MTGKAMPTTAVADTTKLLLWKAYTLEQAASSTGLPFLLGIVTNLVTPLQNGGLEMVNASTASKSFGFMKSLTTAELSAAVLDALAMFQNMTTDQLSAFLNTRRVGVTHASFGGCYRYC